MISRALSVQNLTVPLDGLLTRSVMDSDTPWVLQVYGPSTSFCVKTLGWEVPRHRTGFTDVEDDRGPVLSRPDTVRVCGFCPGYGYGTLTPRRLGTWEYGRSRRTLTGGPIWESSPGCHIGSNETDAPNNHRILVKCPPRTRTPRPPV